MKSGDSLDNRLGNSLGIDFGTSGARAVVINPAGEVLTQVSLSTPVTTALPTAPLTDLWRHMLFGLIGQIPQSLRPTIQSIAINGTSSTVLLCDQAGIPLAAPMLYNDDRGQSCLDQIRAMAPVQHTVVSATSSLAKLLWWAEVQNPGWFVSPLPHFVHQADWLAFLLHGQLGISDYHNALKLGYDVEQLRYPDWLLHHPLPFQLPQVFAPGTPVAPIQPHLAQQWHLSPTCLICAGTTDSIAAFLASGAKSPGQAVTSLGSTLVLKLLSHTRVEEARYGVYSHRLGDLWLVGGASNTGGAVLRQFFSDADLQTLSAQIQPDLPSPLDYYPLPKLGERFPVNDPHLAPRLTPRPTDPVAFLHGLLESMSRIEAQGYRLLEQLGASPLQQVYTAGGGAKNQVWTMLRGRHLQVPVQPSLHTEAAYGTALLAQFGLAQPRIDR